MTTLSYLSQQTRVSQQEVADAPKLRVNFAGIIGPVTGGAGLTLVAPTNAQLGRVVGTNGAVQLPGAPSYSISARRPYATPDADPCLIIVDEDGTGTAISTYETPQNGGMIEILDVPAGAVVRVISKTANPSPLDAVTYSIPQLNQY